MDTKNVAASTTMWAALIAVAGAGLSSFGINLGTGVDQDVIHAVGATVTAWGAIWVIVERWKKGDLYIRNKPPSG